jgi:ATP-binding cassette subfamily F protein 3
MHFGGPVLLDDVSLDVEPGAKIGVIGHNGAGKSTLLKLLVGQLEPTSGDVVRRRGVRVAYQAQELPCDPASTVWEEMRRVFEAEHARDARLRALEEQLAGELSDVEKGRLLAEYETLQHAHEASGGYDVDRRIETVLSSLGLPESAWHQTIAGFSGGERNVIGLARVLLSEPDVMLLDEPSNHLDMEGVEWFVDFVRRSTAAVVMVSHNRHVLDATIDHIWEVDRGHVIPWTGAWSDYQRQKAEAQALQERQWKVQERLVRRIEFQARRLADMAKAYDDPGQARRAKSMLKRLEMMDKVEKPDAERKRFAASFADATRSGRIALSVKDFSFAYGDRPIFDKANLEIEFGERVCLVGPNGSGKTTLFRELLEKGSWENPTLRLGKAVKVGEYRQMHDILDADATIHDWCCEATKLLRTPAAELLHRFLFTHEDLSRKVSTLSGGEKSRLQLARLVAAKVNFLLLDEPTNHLDLASCEHLEEMLEEFEGTLLVISHDRYFLDRLVDRVVEVEDRKLVSHKTSFAKWWEAKSEARAKRRKGALELRSRKGAAESADSAAQDDREEKKAKAREVRRLQTEMRSLEQRIVKLEERQIEISARLEAHYGGGGDHKEGRSIADDAESVRKEVETLYERWSALAGALEASGESDRT